MTLELVIFCEDFRAFSVERGSGMRQGYESFLLILKDVMFDVFE